MIILLKNLFPSRRIRPVLPPFGISFLFIPLFFLSFFASYAHSAQVTLAWDDNTESGITGYKIYYGTSSRSYPHSVDVGNPTSCTVTNLLDKTTYYFAATAYNGIGEESGFSNEVVYTTPAPVSLCTYSISPAAQSFSASGGSGAVTVTAGSACAWTAISNASWILITSNSSSSGARTVNYSVSPNTGIGSRTGTLTVAGRIFSVSQSGSVNYTITASAASGGTISPSGALTISAGAGQTFTITPAGGYQVSSVLVDGTSAGALTSYTFNNVTANHTISASFAASSASWTLCANEGQLCSFTGTQNVRYGANGVYVSKTLTNGTMCTNSVFGNPIAGVVKQCHLPAGAGTVVFAANSGGPAYTLSDGTLFQSDRSYSGGSTWTTSAAISGTSNDTLYQSERYGNFSYSIPLMNGTYTVVLRFAEIYWSSPGQRVFDVFIEGTKVLSNFDIFAVVGKNNGHAVSFPATVMDGKLDVSFRSIVDNAKLSAIMVETR